MLPLFTFPFNSPDQLPSVALRLDRCQPVRGSKSQFLAKVVESSKVSSKMGRRVEESSLEMVAVAEGVEMEAFMGEERLTEKVSFSSMLLSPATSIEMV